MVKQTNKTQKNHLKINSLTVLFIKCFVGNSSFNFIFLKHQILQQTKPIPVRIQ